MMTKCAINLSTATGSNTLTSDSMVEDEHLTHSSRACAGDISIDMATRLVHLQSVRHHDVFVHWDPRDRTYICASGTLGACLFTPSEASACLAAMTGSERHLWRVACAAGSVLSTQEAPPGLYEQLFKTADYKRVRRVRERVLQVYSGVTGVTVQSERVRMAGGSTG